MNECPVDRRRLRRSASRYDDYAAASRAGQMLPVCESPRRPGYVQVLSHQQPQQLRVGGPQRVDDRLDT